MQQNTTPLNYEADELWKLANGLDGSIPIPPQTTPALDNYKLLELYEAAMLSPRPTTSAALANEQDNFLPALDHKRNLAPYTSRPPSWGVTPNLHLHKDDNDNTQLFQRLPGLRNAPGRKKKLNNTGVGLNEIVLGTADKTNRPATSGLPPYMVRSTADEVERLPAIHPSVWVIF